MQKFKRMLLVLLLPSLIWVLSSACGLGGSDESSSAEATTEQESTAEPSSQTNETADTSEPATTEPVVEEQEPLEVREATTVLAAAEILDLRGLSLPTEIKSTGNNEVGHRSFELSDDVATVVDFYQPTFIEQGWQNDTDNEYTSETTANRYFSKDGFVVSMSVSDLGQSTMVTFINHGNIDLRALPQTSDAEPLHQFPNTLGYVSPSEVSEVADFTRQALAEQGWQEYTMPDTSTANNADSQNLMFIQNGLELSAFITVAPAQGNKTSVQYNIILLPMDLPIYQEVMGLEYDGYYPYLGFRTTSNIETVADFYRVEMSDLGWFEMPDTATITPEQATLFFVNEAEELSLMLDLTIDDGQTKAVLRQYDVEELYALPEGQSEGDTLTDDTTTTATDMSAMPAFLVPDEAQNIEYYSDEAMITYDTAMDMDSLLDFYRQALTKAGWDESYATIDEIYSDLEFVQGDEYLYVQLDKSTGDEIFTIVDLYGAPSISGDEVASTSGDAGSSTADMPPLPTPDDAQNVTYDADYGEIAYTSPSDIETLVEFYREMLSADGWEEDEFFSIVDESSAFVDFTKNDDSIFLAMFDFSGETEVSIDVSGAYSLLGSDTSSSETASTVDSGPLTADEDYDGDFPLPANNTGYGAGGTDFSYEMETSSPSDLPTVLDFYLSELEILGWQPVSDTAATTDTTAKTVTFEGPEGELTLDLQVSGGETQIIIKSKNKAAAEAMGILPPTGQARIVLTNWDDAELVLTIADKTFTLPPNAAEEDPDPELMLDVSPGSHTYTLTDASGNEIETLTIEVGADETWGLIAGLDGVLPLQLY